MDVGIGWNSVPEFGGQTSACSGLGNLLES